MYTWEKGGFRLTLCEVKRENSRVFWNYEFRHNGATIFWGSDYSTHYSTSRKNVISGILSFLSCRPGWDTDDEYFKDYTPWQLEWATKYGEELSLYCQD